MFHRFLLIYCWFIRSLLYFFPDIPLFMRFRGWLYGLFMKKCGKDFQVTHDVVIKDIQNISIGNNCFLGNHTVIMGSGEIIIDDEVIIAPHVILISGNHSSEAGSFRYGKSVAGGIRIGRGCWIAGNCTIQKDSKLPSNSVLSANSFLNKCYDIPDSVYGGVPAKWLKNLNRNA